MPLHVERYPEGLLLQIREERISEDTTCRLAPGEDVECDCRMVLDLRDVTFVEPFGLVYLYWLVRSLFDRGAERVTVLLPESEDVRNYLIRMHLPQSLAGASRVRFRPDLEDLRVRERDLTDRLVELTPFTVENDDEVRMQTSEIMETILSHADDLSIEAGYLRLGLVELLSNIEVHSRTRMGVVAVQRYTDGRVRIAVGDGGIGIPNALRGTVGDLPDDEVVLRALQPDVTSRVGRGGLGLPMLVDAIHETRGYMVIRSGRAHIRVRSREEIAARCDCIPIPGTQIEVLWV